VEAQVDVVVKNIRALLLKGATPEARFTPVKKHYFALTPTSGFYISKTNKSDLLYIFVVAFEILHSIFTVRVSEISSTSLKKVKRHWEKLMDAAQESDADHRAAPPIDTSFLGDRIVPSPSFFFMLSLSFLLLLSNTYDSCPFYSLHNLLLTNVLLR